MKKQKMMDSLKEFKFSNAESLSKINGGQRAGEDTFCNRSGANNVADDCLEPNGPVIVVQLPA